MPKDAEAERLKKMKKMSRVLGINIHQVAAMLEKQERAANGEIDEEEETPPAAAAAATPAAAAAASPENDDPFSKFMREQNGGAQGEGAGAGAAGSDAASSAVTTKPSAKKKDEEMPPCTVLFIGGTDWTALGRRPTEGDILCPKRLLSFPKKIKFVASGPTACHSVCIDVQGGVYTWGRNEFGGLGHGDTAPRAHPTLVAALSGTRMKQASCGKTHTGILAENGTLYMMGGGKLGQLGLGRAVESCTEPKAVEVPGGTVEKVACGAEFTAIIDNRGRLLTFGSPQDGQLGGGTTGEFIEKAGKISYDLVLAPAVVSTFFSKDARTKAIEEFRGVELADIACGKSHGVAVEKGPRARVFTWGFGGYGRLGHACQDQELRPRMVDVLARMTHLKVTKVAAGAGCSLAITENGHLFYWGKLPNAPRGEATMYPKIVEDLSNWQTRSVAGSNGALLVAAETSTISWGTSVAGELGYGEDIGTPRTSTKPKLVNALEGLTVMQVAMGLGHSLLLAEENEKSQAILKGLGECVPFEGDGGGGGAEEEEEEEEEGPPAKKRRGRPAGSSKKGGKGSSKKGAAGAKGKGRAKR
ncbi:unnamed protein product [Ectocarpus sp. CCAP 1310/34]|nr:unnamed protein product [Ectocarpus sp. CCAP 1310/34]